MMKNGSKGVGLQDGTKKTKREKRAAEQCGGEKKRRSEKCDLVDKPQLGGS
jgi:hypothetical protein